jgi:hypothetical protein
MRTFEFIDDKQLWRIADNHNGEDYSWPLYATPASDGNAALYYVQLAMPIDSKEQRDFVYPRIDAIAQEFDSTRIAWLVSKGTFEAAAHKCKGVSPDFYTKWPKVHEGGQPQQPPPPFKLPSDAVWDEAFVRDVANASGITDIAHLRLMWNTFCFHSVKWMMEQNKPLNMGFATIHALPYRKNWCGILHARWPGILKAFKSNRVKEFFEMFGIDQVFWSADIIGMSTRKTIGWTLEIVTTDRFDKEIDAMEERILDECPQPVSYCYRWSKLVEKKYDEIIKVFGHWVEKASLPRADLDQSQPRDSWVLKPRVAKGTVRPAKEPPCKTYYSTAVDTTKNTGPTASIVDMEALEKVQEVPDDGSFAFNLRPHRRVERLAPPANTGLLVSDVAGVPSAYQALLSGPDES